MINFGCPCCGKRFHAKDEHAGMRTKCPKCGETIHVPAERPLGDGEYVSVTTPAPPPVRSPAYAGEPSRQETTALSNDFTPASQTPGPSINRVRLFAGIGIVAVLLVLVTTLWVRKTVLVTGELFVTTEGGDVKKIAGTKVWITPVTHDLRTAVKTNLTKAEQLWTNENQLAEKYKDLDSSDPHAGQAWAALDKYRKEEYTPQMDALFTQTSALLQERAYQATTDGDGKFKVEVTRGNYLVWTPKLSILNVILVWCKAVDLSAFSASQKHLIMNQDEAIDVLWGDEKWHRGLGVALDIPGTR